VLPTQTTFNQGSSGESLTESWDFLKATNVLLCQFEAHTGNPGGVAEDGGEVLKVAK
jgi:hypothetical protein